MYLRPVFSLLTAAAIVAPITALTPAEWRSQSVYQVMTDRFARTDLSIDAECSAARQIYCGGTWQGLISELDYIQGMGFTAIWISPFVEQMPSNSTDGSSYHGYWAQDIYSVNSMFGTSDDLRDLSTALHDRDMYLMLDVVTNHMAYKGCGDCVDYSGFVPFDSKSYFHDFCLIDYNNITSCQDCWEGDNVVALADLRTEDSDVVDVWTDWIQQVVANYSIDGIRLDSALQVDFNFTPKFEAAAGMYLIGEVFNSDPDVVTPYQQYMSGLMNYPVFYYVTHAFESTSGSISKLTAGINRMKDQAADTSLYGSFLENHDNPRFASRTGDMALAQNAIAFTMLMDGIPIVYQGQEQHYDGAKVPYNREALWRSGFNTTSELYGWIADLNAIRNWAISVNSTYLDYQAYPIYSDSNSIAMRKGFTGNQVVSVYSNVGSSGNATVTLDAGVTGFTAGQALVDVMSCTSFTAGSSGNLTVTISEGVPRVFYAESALSGSSICRSTSSTATTATATPTTSSTTATAKGCTATSVAITFDELVTTSYGSTVKIAGNVAALGKWDADDAVALSASGYTASNPLWDVSVQLTPASVVEYKFIVVNSTGTTWESDPNHTLTVPCSATTVSSKWQL